MDLIYRHLKDSALVGILKNENGKGLQRTITLSGVAQTVTVC